MIYPIQHFNTAQHRDAAAMVTAESGHTLRNLGDWLEVTSATHLVPRQSLNTFYRWSSVSVKSLGDVAVPKGLSKETPHRRGWSKPWGGGASGLQKGEEMMISGPTQGW